MKQIRTLKIPIAITISVLMTLSLGWSFTKQYLGPGKDRWKFKTELAKGKVTSKPKVITVDQMRGLDVPDAQTLKDAGLDASLLSTDLKDGFHEGDIVKMDGYIQLVAMETTCASKAGQPKCGTKTKPFTDGDYHIQVTDKYDLRDSNIVVEVPHPDFVSNAALKSKVTALRTKLQTTLVGGKEFGTNCMVHPPHVSITGQLFIDSFHAIQNPGVPGGGRGKQGHKSATVWEIYPVFGITFLDKKGGNKPDLTCPSGGAAKNVEWVTEG